MRGPLVPLVLWLAALPGAARGQAPGWDRSTVQASRPSLEQLERRFEGAAESPAYSPVLRAEARAEAAKLRERLRTGDFRPGDRVWLMVEREDALSDTFTVAQQRQLELPGIGTVSLEGLLRSEVEPHLRTFLGRFVRDPVVRARPFIRVSITGEVTNAGFYSVPPDIVLADVLGFAGGVTEAARVTEITIRRNDTVLWDSKEVPEVLWEGRTLDQLDVRSGDQIVVGGGEGIGLGALDVGIRTVGYILAIPFTIVGLVSLF